MLHTVTEDLLLFQTYLVFMKSPSLDKSHLFYLLSLTRCVSIQNAHRSSHLNYFADFSLLIDSNMVIELTISSVPDVGISSWISI